jgi:hypothetical protein
MSKAKISIYGVTYSVTHDEDNRDTPFVTNYKQFGEDCDKSIDVQHTIDFMDDDLRESLHGKVGLDTELQFFIAYCRAHKKQFGADFIQALL